MTVAFTTLGKHLVKVSVKTDLHFTSSPPFLPFHASLPFHPPPDPLSQLQAVNGGEEGSEVPRKMRVLYPYNPATDSPNDNPAEELALEVGDVITVFGWPDEDGYYQVGCCYGVYRYQVG